MEYLRNIYRIFYIGDIMLYFMLIVYISVLIIFSVRNIKPSKCIFYALSGFFTLTGLDYILSYIGMSIPLNIFTITAAATGGLPAMIMTVTLQWIFS